MINIIKMLEEAGKIALQYQKELTVQTKPDGTIVSNADIAVSNFLVEELNKLFPEYSIFSEENAGILPVKDKVIIIDPIDGTESFVRKESSWAILIGFVNKNTIEQGFVYLPALKKIYYAEKNKGAYSYCMDKGESTKIITEDKPKNLLKGISSPPKNGEKEFFKKNGIEVFETSYTNSYKTMMIVEGLFDIMPNFAKKCSIWDIIAPMIILEEAGGKYVFDGELQINYKNHNVPLKFAGINKNIKKIKF